MASFDSLSVGAALIVKDNLRKCEMSIMEGTIELQNIVLKGAAKMSRSLTKEAKEPYPPSRHRAPGTMKRSIRTIKATDKHPGKNVMDTWLWEWAEGQKSKDNVVHHRNIKKGDKSIGRFAVKKEGGKRVAGMIETDPRRLLGLPMQRWLNLVKNDNRLVKTMDKAIEKNEIPQWQLDAEAFAADYKNKWNALYKR